MDNNNLGILFADEGQSGIKHPYFAGVLDSFIKNAEKKGYDVAFMNRSKTRPRRVTYLEQAAQRGFEGILIACIDYSDPEVKELIESGIPMVAIDEDVKGAISVKSDNFQGIRELTSYIISMGHKRIAYIKGNENTVTNLRLNGFLDTCAENGISIPEEYIRPGSFTDMDNASYQTEYLLRLKNPPSCIIYSDDMAAIGGINIIRARGLSIPTDISIAGYDGNLIISNYEPRLTTVVQNTEEIGKISADRLIDRIEMGSISSTETVTVKTVIEKGRTIGKIYG